MRFFVPKWLTNYLNVMCSWLGMLPGTWAYVSAGAIGRAFIVSYNSISYSYFLNFFVEFKKSLESVLQSSEVLAVRI